MKDAKSAVGHPAATDQVFQRLFGAVSDAVLWAIPETGRVICCNSAAERLFETSRSELIGTLLREVYPRGNADPWVGLLAGSTTGSCHGPLVGEVFTSTGRVVAVRVFTSLVEAGGRLAIQGVFQDTDPPRDVDRTPSIARFILDNSPAVFWRCRVEKERPVEWVAGNLGLFGYSREDFLSGRVPYSSLLHPEDRDRVLDDMEEFAFRGLSTFRLEYRIVTKRGEVRWLDDRVSVERDADGRVTHFYGVAVDISESKRAELTRIQSEDRFRAIVETSSDWIWETDEHGIFTYASPTVHDLLGYKPREVLGKRPLDLMPSGEAQHMAHLLESHLNAPAPFTNFEQRLLHRDGREIVLETSAITIFDAGGQFRGYRGIARDITRRGQTEDEIRQRNRELESLAAITRRAGRSLDLDHLLETLLPEIARVLDVGPVLLFLSDGGPSLTLRGSFPPAGDARLEEAELQMGECLCGLAAQGGMSVFSEDMANDPRVTLNACKGTGLVSVAAIPLQSAHNRTGILAVASASRRDFRQNEHFLSAIADSLATAIENADLYQEIRIHAAALERRVAERTAELETANKELEAFSYTVSHDLKAPLRSIDGFSKCLEEEYGHALDQEGKGYLHRVRNAAHRMGQLIDDLLKLSRLTRGELRREQVDLTTLARTVASQLEKSGGERPVDFVIAERMNAWGDPRLLLVALENLIQNAWKFSAFQPKARIEVGMVNFTGQKAYFVRDNGVGFDPVQAHRLFQPFRRLHPASEFPGSGIGLATVQRIVHRHGGKVWIEAKQGLGATVYFTL